MVKKIADRERAPIFKVGKITADKKFRVKDRSNDIETIDLDLDSLFGDAPKIMTDSSIESNYMEIEYDSKLFNEYLKMFKNRGCCMQRLAYK